MPHPVCASSKGVCPECLSCLCRLQSDNTVLQSAAKAEANARAADKAEFLDKQARMSEHVESLKVQGPCRSSAFSIDSLFCMPSCLSMIPPACMHAWQRKAQALMQ